VTSTELYALNLSSSHQTSRNGYEATAGLSNLEHQKSPPGGLILTFLARRNFNEGGFPSFPLSVIFRALMQSSEERARDKIEFTASAKLKNTIRANLARLAYGR